MPSTQKLVSKITVSLSRRKVMAFAGQDRICEFDCVIGRAGHETAPGLFHIFKKEPMHHSHAYGNTPMPYSMFFSEDGKAIHGTPLATLRSYAGVLGFGSLIPAVGSHGCVGLSNDDAKALYDLTPRGTSVQIML
jgi:lipoprotein-anchoring transpeptidase ErfK/SrfK